MVQTGVQAVLPEESAKAETVYPHDIPFVFPDGRDVFVYQIQVKIQLVWRRVYSEVHRLDPAKTSQTVARQFLLECPDRQ